MTDDWGTKSITCELFRLKGIDFENLACGHDSPTVMWSPDGLTLWVGQESSSKVYAYNLADESLNPTASWTLATGNDKPVGVWSNASHVYVVDGDDRDVYRYNLTNKSAGTATLLTNAITSTNADRVGAWADGDTMWVSDRVDSKLYAYTLSDFSRDSGKDIDLHSDNGEARDIWSDGHAIWVLDADDEKLYVYALSDGSRKADLDITLDGAGENYNSIWSDGETMYVVENTGTSTTRTPQIHKLPLPTEVLVSNALQSAPSNIPHSSDHAQTFQTGDNYQGYTLEGVTLTATNNVSVTLAVWTTDANGRPDAFHATLTPPASYAAGAVEFTAPADTVLARNTTYALRVGNASGATLDGTTSDAEDAGGQTGWSIGDTHLLWDTATGSWQEDGMSRSYRVTFEGRSNPDTVPGPPILTDLREGHRGLLAEWDSPTDIGDGSIMGAAFWQAEYTRADGTASFHMGVLGNPFRINLNDGEWTFRIRYQNSLGYGQWSNALTATVAPATVTIEGGAAVDEGADAQFTVTSDRFRVTIADDLTVHLDVTEDRDVVPAASEGRISVSFDLSDNNDIANRTKTITVPTEDDSVVEFDSTVTAIIVADSDYIVGFPSEAGVLVDDDEPHDTPFAVEDLAARPAGPGRVFLSWSAVTEQRGDRISRFEYLQAENGGPPKSSSDARIIATLPAGTYTIEAASFIDVPTTVSGIEPTGSFTLSVSAGGGGGGAPGSVATGCTPASLSLPVSGVEGAWANDCKSSVPGRGWARYYTFSLAASAEVTIELQGSHDPHLYLREGSATSGTALHENSDIGSWLYIIPGSDDATTSHFVTGLNNGVSYTFEVRAVNAIGPADPSNSASATPSASVTPFEIEDLKAAAGGDGQATLSWTVPHFGGSPITKFQYRQKKSGGAYGNWKNITGSGPTTDSFTVPDLRVGDRYTFQVRAVNSHGEADASNEASLTVLTGVLLTNLSQAGGGVSNNNINNFNDTSQPFTTGSGPNIGSYTLQSINIVGAAALATLPTLTVTLEADASGNPSGTPLCTFTNPSSWKSGPNNEFTLATQCRLDPGVKYHIAMDAGGALQLKHNNGGIDDDDISADNWEFHTRRREDSSNGWEAPASASAFRMSLFGAIGLTPDAISGRETGLHATAFDEEVRLFWERPHDGGLPITKYQYRQKAGSGDYGDWKNISGSNLGQPHHTVKRLTNGTRYTFQVRAVNASGEAQPSNEATAVPREDDCRQSSNESTCTVSVGTPFNGSIEAANIDIDWVKLTATGGTTYQIDLEGHQSGKGTLPDPYITGLYTKGGLVEFGLGRIPDIYNDDVSPANKDARVIWTAHRDIEVFISVFSSRKDPMGMGTYTLTVTQRGGPPPPLPEPPAPAATLTLLSNFNVGERRIVTIIDPDPEHYDHITEFSQPFTTGSNSQEYTLGSIGLIGRDWLHGPPPLIVTLRSDFGGNPSSTVLATFTNFPSWKPVGPDGGLIFSIFSAPSGTTLKPNTKYHIHIQPDTRIKLETVRDLGETFGSLSGWDIHNARRKTRDNPNWHRENNANQAVRLGVFGQVTGQQTAQATTTAGAPKIFIATAKGPAQVDLIWTTPEFGDATGYGIQRSADGETGWQAVEPLDDDGDTMYRHVGLTPETIYHYRMRYLTEDGPGEWTYPVAATTATDAWRLTAAAFSKTQVDLSWTAPEEEFIGYYVEWSADGETGWTATDPLHSGTEAGYSHNGLTEGTTYHYRVLAVNGNIPGAWSPVVSATTEEADNTPATGAPAITGTAQVGGILTADASRIADADGLENAVFSYKWLADGADISGATDSTYTPVVDDAGRAIGVRVSFTDDRGFEESLTGAAGTVPADDYTVNEVWETGNWGRVTVGGSATGVVEKPGDRDFFGVNLSQGGTYRIDVAGHGDVGALEQVRLYGVFVYAEDLECSGAYDDPGVTTYVLTAEHSAPHSVAVRAEGDGTGVYRVSVSESDDTGTGCDTAPVAAAQAANTPATGAPAITGMVRVGETLTADTSAIEDADGLDNAVSAYQWQADDAEISGANGSAYTLAVADEGKAISVTVTFTDDRGHGEELTSATTDPVEAKPNTPATGAPTISGTAQVGETLTADVSGILDEDGLTNAVFSYQWVVNEESDDSTGASYTVVVADDGSATWVPNDGTADTDIEGATGPTYTLTEADEGRPIRVRVSFTDDSGNSETLISAPTLMAGIHAAPTSHDGESVFTFELRFSEEFGISYKTLRDHAFTVTGGTVRKAQRLEQGSNIGWRITVSPDSSGALTIILPITEDCDAQGAICTEDGRMLSTELVLTVSGP